MSATQLRWFAALLWSPWKMQKTSVHVTSESGKIQQDNKHNKWKHHEILGTNDFIILTTYLKGPSKLLGKNEKAMRRATLSHPEAMSACARGQQWVWVPGGPICGFVWTSKRRITNYVTTLWLIHIWFISRASFDMMSFDVPCCVFCFPFYWHVFYQVKLNWQSCTFWILSFKFRGNLVIPPASEEFALGILAETRAKGDRKMWIQRDQGRVTLRWMLVMAEFF